MMKKWYIDKDLANTLEDLESILSSHSIRQKPRVVTDRCWRGTHKNCWKSNFIYSAGWHYHISWAVTRIVGQFPDRILHRGQIPDWHLPDGHFPDRHFPERTIPRPDTSPKDTSPTGHFPTKTFPRTNISATITYFQISTFLSETI